MDCSNHLKQLDGPQQPPDEGRRRREKPKEAACFSFPTSAACIALQRVASNRIVLDFSRTADELGGSKGLIHRRRSCNMHGLVSHRGVGLVVLPAPRSPRRAGRSRPWCWVCWPPGSRAPACPWPVSLGPTTRKKRKTHELIFCKSNALDVAFSDFLRTELGVAPVPLGFRADAQPRRNRPCFQSLRDRCLPSSRTKSRLSQTADPNR